MLPGLLSIEFPKGCKKREEVVARDKEVVGGGEEVGRGEECNILFFGPLHLRKGIGVSGQIQLSSTVICDIIR